MSTVQFVLDGQAIEAQDGQTILKAAEAAGVYIPHLCAFKDLIPHGSCRVCSVRVNGRIQAACVQTVTTGAVVESETPEILEFRRNIIDMLFAEGNHFCMFCEKSGNCELQALAYRFGIAAPGFPYAFPQRDADASHPDIRIDRDRCVLCARCVRASRELDGKAVFGFTGRGTGKRLGVDAASGLGGTSATAGDRAIAACPTGSLLLKRTGYAVPIGERRFDRLPIGADIELPPAGE